jgi:CHAT domain-containing protein/tetratricopeptide (TPR) repeat protein
MRRATNYMIGMIVAIGWTLVGYAQDAPQPPQQPAPTHQDAPPPDPHPELKPLMEEARTLLNNGKFQDALPKTDELLQRAKAKGDKIGEAYALRFRATALQRLRQTTPDQLPEVAEIWASAAALWREIGDGAYQVEALLGQAYCLWRALPERAQALLQDALQLAKGEGKRPLAVAKGLDNAGIDWYRIRQIATAEQLFQQALIIYEKNVPNSLEVAHVLYGLGSVVAARGELVRSEQLFQQALAIYETLVPNSLNVAGTLASLGNVAAARGELVRAEELYQQALAIQEKLAPNSLEVAHTLVNLGAVASDRGELVRAEELYQQALAIFEQLAPNSLEVATALNRLGTVAYARGDLAGAKQALERALAIQEQLAPNSLEVAYTLGNLGAVASDRGELARAEELHQQALAIFEQLAPNSLEVAYTLGNLGIVARNRGDLARAEQLLQQALAIYEKLAPNSLRLAQTLQNLAILARQQKNYPQAQQYLARALKIYETQRTAISDPETKAAFAERYFNAYALQALIALDQQQPQQAAYALERSRARTLAELMHARALPIPADAPEALRDLIAQREQLQRDYLLLAREQRKARADNAETVQRLQTKARELADRQRQLDHQLRQQFPNYAALLHPEPPRLKQVQSALDPNTVLLYHAFADKELLILAVSRQAVRGYRVKTNLRVLEQDIEQFQQIVATPPWKRTALERRKLLTLGQRLYAALIKPAEPSLKNATTVLLCPEGALSQLPWGALVVAVDKQQRPTYWVERVAIGLTLSAGVYLQARAVRPAPRGVAIAAVSQYRRQQAAQAPKTEQLVRRSGRALGDLPAVRQEVAQLQRLLGKQGVVVAQEDKATPKRAHQMAQQARVVHFACHARADDVDPLGSGLLLAPAGSDEGLLTAADVVSGWQLRADVVMLSASGTAVGEVRRYEGLYGLARAFLYAGARSVGASLWQVEDMSAARLMGGFYRGYVGGIGKAEALRRAQVGLLRDKRYADPYYWSGFVLMGAER